MQETLHYLLMANHFKFRKMLFTNLKDTGLTMGQPKVLDYLNEHDGAMQKDIAVACNIEPASLTSVLDGMEKKGLIAKNMRDGNRRSLYVSLTEKGARLAKRVVAEFYAIEKKALQGFSDVERDALGEFLLRINRNINA